MAYLDPGNLEGDLQQGAYTGYQLLWVLFWSTALGWLLQVLAATLGVVTGKDLATHCRTRFCKPVSLTLWLMTEIAIIGSDIQEVIGSAIALKLLFDLPLWIGTLITGLDTFTFLLFHYWGIRKLESVFCAMIFVMCVCFFINWGKSGTDAGQFMFGLFVPTIEDYALIPAVGTLGAVIMPHNIYLHSALVLSRKIDRRDPTKVWEAIKYNAIESGMALLISFFINAAVVVTFTTHFFNVGCASLEAGNFACVDTRSDGIPEDDYFNGISPDTCVNEHNGYGRCAEIGLSTAGHALGQTLGSAAKYIWGVGVLASGQASTMTGTYAGQFVMQGFLQLKVAPWKRTMMTRLVALGPAVIVALGTAHDPVISDTLNEWLNVLQSIQLPFALLPVLILTSSALVMEQFVNTPATNFIGWCGAALVFAANLYLVIDFCWEDNSKHVPSADWFHPTVIFLLVLYFVFIGWVIYDGIVGFALRANKADRDKHM